MNRMSKYANRFLHKFVPAILALTVLIITALFVWNEASLNQAQQKFIALLEHQAGNYNEGRVVLPSTSRAEAQRMAREFGGTLRITPNGRFAVINLPQGMTLADIADNENYRKYLNRIGLDYNNFSTADEDVADDTEIRSGYVVEDPMYVQQTYIDYLNIGGAWDLTRGSDSEGNKVTIAVIDTGIDTDHPEFVDAAGNSIISTQSYDATNDKVVDQYDISVIEDINGHGTAVAGVIAAQMNEVGITGIAPEVELLVIKCEVDEAGEFKSSADIVFAIYYAIEMDVDVINMSLGGGGGEDMQKALQLAVDSDIICVAAAGNGMTDAPHFPAAYETVIGVGALMDSSWEIADYSNFGINSDIMAPGTALTTAVGGEYTYQTGTSISAPMVSAAVALYKSQNRYAAYDDLKAELLAAGKDLGDPGEDSLYGFGALDINAFICEEKGTITYDYCTEEIKPTTQVFVRRHTIQTVPEPERENIVFDDWYYDKAYTRVFDYDTWYSTEFVEDVTLYAKWVNEDDEDASVYNYRTLFDGTIEIVSYKGKRRYLTIPNEIDGKVVSSIGQGAFAYNNRLREVTLPEGLVYIKANAFFGVGKMREISFTGEKLTVIDKGAFGKCVCLKKLDLPDSVTTIGETAFGSCTAMTAVSISENSKLATIGDFAFSGTAISSFYIPANVNAEGFNGSVLSGCAAMRSVSVHPGNVAFTVGGSTLYNSAKTEIIYYPAALSGSYTVANGVSTVGQYAFHGSCISGLELNAVSNIEENAFAGTKKLSSVVLPDTVTELGYAAFESSSIKQVVLSANLTEISGHAFSASKLTQVHIPANVVRINTCAFMNCGYLQNLTFAEGSSLTTIGHSAFESCAILKDFVLPQSLMRIEDWAFHNCRAITKLTIPSGVSYMGTAAFRSCSMLQQVDFAEGCVLNEIRAACFEYCTMLETVNFSDNIVKLGECAFNNDRLLQNLNFGEGSSLTIVGDSCFYSCSALQTMQLPESVTAIGKFAYAFSGLTRVDVTAGMTDIGHGAFGACYLLTQITVAEANTAYASVDNVLFSKDITTVYCVPASRTGSYTLPETVKITAPYSFYYDKLLTAVILPQNLEDIQMNSFYSCNSLAGIEIPANVTNIGRQAFENCYSLDSVTFSHGSRLERLGIYTFVNCGFSEITIPASVREIAQYVFFNCNKLRKITFEENSALTYIAAYLFKGTCVETVVFEEGSALTSLQAHAFDGAYYLKNVDFGDAKITNMDNYAFYRCFRLEEISIPDTVTYVGRYAFYGCSKLNRVDLPETVDYIGEAAFVGTNNIRVFFAADALPANAQIDWDKGISGYFLGAVDYVVTDEWEYSVRSDGTIALSAYHGMAGELEIDTLDGYTVSRIGARCFYRNGVLAKITLSENIVEIGNYAFYGCSNLASLTVPASVERIGKYAFGDSDTSVTIADGSGLEVIDDFAFSRNDTAAIVLPDTVRVIGDGAFQNSGLTDLQISQASSLESIGQQAFAGSGVTKIYLPASLKTVGAEAFRDVTGLVDVEIAAGDTALKLSNGAFEGSGVRELTIPARVWYIGEYTFGSCRNLQNIHVDSGNTAYTSLDGVLCDVNGTTLIQYPCGRSGAYEVPAQITVLTYSSFRDAKHLTEVTFAEGSAVRTIGWQTFSGCESLTKITVPDTVVSFDFYAFENCTALTDVILGEGTQLTGVYEGAFYNCTALTNIALPDTVVEISDYAFYNCESLDTFPLPEDSQVKGIYDYAFYGCGGITEIPVLPQLVEIGEYAFARTAVTEYTLGATVKEVASNAFAGCETLTVIFCDEKNEEYAAIDGALYERGADDAGDLDALVIWPGGNTWILGEGKTVITNADTEIVRSYPYIRFEIADTVTTLAQGAFFACSELEYIRIPGSVTTIENMAFTGCPRLTSAGPVGGGYDIEFEWTDRIPAQAFRNCHSLSSVTLPETLQVIERYAFDSCSNLRSIYIPRSVTVIGKHALKGCGNVIFGADTLPPGLEEDWLGYYDSTYYLGGKEVFQENGLTLLLRLDNTVAAIEYSGKNMVVEIPSSVAGYPVREITTGLLDEWRYSENGPAALWIPASVTKISSHAFSEYNLILMMESEWKPSQASSYWDENCEVVYGVTGYGKTNYGQFYCISKGKEVAVGRYYGEQTKVVIPEKIGGLPVTRVLAHAFRDCSELKNVVIPAGVTSIGESAFYSCDALSEIVLPEGMTSLGRFAFRFCSSLTEISLPDGITVLKQSTFDDCTSLKSVVLPKKLEEFDNYVFYDCTSLSSIVIPENVSDIPYRLFHNCENLKTVYIQSPAVAAELIEGDDALCLCDYAQTIAIAENITEIGGYVTDHYEQTETLKRDGVAYVAYGTHAHTWNQIQNIAYVACSQEGYEAYSCNQCGLEKNLTTPAHDLSQEVVTKMTCREDGLVRTSCSLCDFFVDERIPSPGEHSMGLWYTVEQEDSGTTGSSRRDCELCDHYETGAFTTVGSGKCGEKVQWLLTGTGELRITGTGDMQDNLRPWSSYAGQIKTVLIGDGVTCISRNAFAQCTELTSVVIAEGVTRIEFGAFNGCTSLKDVVIPDSVRFIGDYAFQSCSSLTTIDIPDNVRVISECSFRYCGALTEITLPSKLDVIEWASFSGCTNLKSITIPEGVSTIERYAFQSCAALTSVFIPDGLVNIGEDVFEHCSSLASIEASENNPVYSSVDGVLFNKDRTTLRLCPVGRSGSYAIPKGTTTIGPRAFSGCAKLTDISVPEGVVGISEYAFTDCAALKSITIPNSIVGIGRYVFNNCTSLESMVIPATVKAIPEGMFHGCSGLTTITIPGSVAKVENYAFYGCNALQNVYLTDLRAWLDIAYAEYHSGILTCNYKEKYLYLNGALITDLEIPEHVQEIPKNAFYKCVKLESVLIPDGVTKIGDSAFSGCRGLKDITIPDGVTQIGGSAFTGCSSLPDIEIPDSVTQIGSSAFWGCTGFTRIDIPDSVTSIGGSAFYKCSNVTDLKIPDSVTSIGTSAFSHCEKLTDVIIPKGITTIDQYTFSDCTGLVSVTIPEGVTKIDTGAFRDCTSLTEISIPASVTTLGNEVFSACNQLAEITIPDGVTSIGRSAFYNCSALTRVAVLGPVTTLSPYMFYQCTGLVEISLPDTITSIGEYAFAHCGSLSRIDVPKSVTSIGNDAFMNCSGLTDVSLPESLASIGTSAFAKCSSLRHITLPEGITSVGGHAFSQCSSLVDISIPSSVTSLGNYVFSGCTELTGIWVDEANTAYSSDDKGVLFNKDKTLLIRAPAHLQGEYVIPSSTTSISAEAFHGCADMKGITIPSGVTKISGSAFHSCFGLEKIWFNAVEVKDFASWNYVFSYAGQNGNGIHVTIGANVRKIPAYMFQPDTIGRYSPNVISVEFEKGSVCEQVGASAFYECKNLKSITFTGDAPTFGDSSVFGGVNANAYYPAGNDTWTASVRKSYGGTLRWRALCNEHVYTDVIVPPTCTAQGYTTHTCTVCGHSYEDARVEAIGHSYESLVTAPTCTEEGYTTHTCSVCGDSYVDAAVGALGHDMGDWKTVKSATCTEDGYAHRDCSRCGHSEDCVDTAPGHTHAAPVRENEIGATVGAPGSYESVVYCTVCGIEISREKVEIPQILSRTETGEITDDTLPESVQEFYGSASALEDGMVNSVLEHYAAELEQAGVAPEDAISRLLDVELQYSTDGENWVKADEEHFPEGGRLEVVLPVPEGTSHSAHTYFVAHMFTTDAFGKVIGEIEYPQVTEFVGEDGKEYIKFEVTGLSPVMVVSVEAEISVKSVLGDLNLDGEVDSDDLTLLARHVGGIELITGQALANADVNGDGVVNSDDLTRHARYVGGIIKEWD